MAIETSNVIQAAANVNADAAASAFLVNRGFSALVRNGVGDYTLTLEQSAAAAETVATATGIDAALIAVCVVRRPLPTTVQVLTFDVAGAANEADFSLVMHKVIF